MAEGGGALHGEADALLASGDELVTGENFGSGTVVHRPGNVLRSVRVGGERSRHDVNKHATAASRRKGAAAAAEAKRCRREEERRLLANARREHLDAALRKLADAAERAAEAIDKLLAAESEPVRLRAAVAVLELLDAAELRELSERLEQLEDHAARNGRPWA
jgi:hypothetical protein